MRRALFALALLGTALVACAGTQRPEGIVERWLISLNQGSAGRPGVYATDDVSQIVLPDWQARDPGELDVIRVGRGGPGEAGTQQVPFGVVYRDGSARRFLATLVRGRVVALPKTHVGPIEPAVERARATAWLAAIGVAVLLVLLTIGLMRLAPEPSAQTGSST